MAHCKPSICADIRSFSIETTVYFFGHRIERGGGLIQAQRTCEALKAIGQSARMVLKEGSISIDDIDLSSQVHHFIGAKPAYIPLMRRIKAMDLGIIALSPIYWWSPRVQRVITPEFIPFWRYTIARYTKRALKHWLTRFEVYKLADLLLPNSPAEGALVRNHFPISPQALVCPIPNATDPIPQSGIAPNPPMSLPEKFVLCAGSFNTRKNQLTLIKALRGTDLSVVFIGAPGWVGETSSYANYYSACQAEASNNMLFLGHIEHRSPEWHELFSRATVFAMASACETPSLSALEAALYGSRVAVTVIGSAFEYFGPHAEYCDPSNQSSVRRAVEAAWIRGKSSEISEHVAARFLWRDAARITVLAYRATLSREEGHIREYEIAVRNLWYDYKAAPSPAGLQKEDA